MRFFTSDWHFNHVNICGPTLSKWDQGYRNFGSLQEMNDTIINRLNERVGSDDELFMLGDVAFGNVQDFFNIRRRINCRTIHLIYGNHDEKIYDSEELRALFATTQDYMELRLGKEHLVLFHYCMRVWHKNGRGAIQLYGHSHGSLPEPAGRQFDIGVDCNEYYPWSLDEVLAKGLGKPIIAEDHHTSTTNYHYTDKRSRR
jgi:calcineurin-like phosphoesterase family protein